MSEPFTDGQVLWKLEDRVVAVTSYGIDGEWYTSGTRIEVQWVEFVVLRATPKGAWIARGKPGDRILGERRWVSTNTHEVGRSQKDAADLAIRRRRFHVKMEKKRLEEAELRLAYLLRAAERTE